jgi:hypothetical protein
MNLWIVVYLIYIMIVWMLQTEKHNHYLRVQ